MGSTYAAWSGHCREHDRQEELIRYLRRLANAGKAYRNAFHDFHDDDVDYNSDGSIRRRVRPRAPKHRMRVREYNCNLRSGPVVVRNDILTDRRALLTFGKQHNTEIIRPSDLASRRHAMHEESTPNVLNDEPLINVHTGDIERCWVKVNALSVFGIEFDMFDPRDGGDRNMSFVFLRSGRHPLLDGCLIRLVRRQRGLFPTAGPFWYVERPSIDLRYMWEDWMLLLMAWLKVFYVPDLMLCLPAWKRGWRANNPRPMLQHMQRIRRQIKVDEAVAVRDTSFHELLICYHMEALSWASASRVDRPKSSGYRQEWADDLEEAERRRRVRAAKMRRHKLKHPETITAIERALGVYK